MLSFLHSASYSTSACSEPDFTKWVNPFIQTWLRRTTIGSVRFLPAYYFTWLLLFSGLLRQDCVMAQCLNYQAPGLYSFTVPAGGPFTVKITAKGGSGGNSSGGAAGGSGTTANATFSLQTGDQLTMIVGATPNDNDRTSGGGGGGTGIVLTRNGVKTLLIAAGGGGGAGERSAALGGGGRGQEGSNGGQGGSGFVDPGSGTSGGGGGGGFNSGGQNGQGVSGGRGGAQATLDASSAGGGTVVGSPGGAGFGGGGGPGGYVSGGGGGGGYGGGDGGTGGPSFGPGQPGQGGSSFISPTGSTTALTPGTTGAGRGQTGFATLEFPSSPVMATITGSNTTICAGNPTTITGTINAVGTWTIILSDGTTRTGTTPTFSIPVTPPSSTTYTIQCVFDSRGVAQAGNLTGSRVVTVNSPSLVAITQQPASGSAVCVGTSVSVPVSTSGTVTGYQWYRNGSVVSGQTSATLSLPSTTTAQSGSYAVVVTGGCNSVTSTAFNLTVDPKSPDYQALEDLYNSTGGANWPRKANWLTGCSPCGWEGVTCDGNGRVIELGLTSNQLSGTLPASLGDLTSLRTLVLNRNQLTGTLPASLSALTSLTRLSLSENQLSGSIPPSLSNLTSLQIVFFNSNRLTGTLPASLSALTQLQIFQVDFNQITGNIPASFGSLTSLRTLNLSQNQLSGPIPASLSSLTGLQNLFLNNNQLSGCFPASLSALCGGGRSVLFSNNPGLPGGGNFGAFCATGAGSDAFRPLATASPNPVCVGSPVSLSVSAGTFYQWGGPAGFAASTQRPGFTPASAASSGLYSVTVGNGSATCTATASVSLTVNPLPVVSITNLASAYCKDAPALTLTGAPTGGNFTVDGTPATQVVPANLAVGNRTVAYRYTDANGCSNTATQSVTIKATPPAPTLLTQSGGTYPASQSAVTVDLNSGTVNLVVGGCQGTIAWSGPGNTSGSGSTIMVSTAQPGVFTYRASCQVDGCSSPLATASVTVAGRLTVLHRDVDNYATNNSVQPVLVLQNQGSGALPLSALTLRYYLTVEGSSALSNLSVNYAQVGNGNVRLRYVPLSPVQQGAAGYVEVSFTAGAGNLAPGANSGSIQAYFAKSDYGSLNEADDYSYNPVRDQLTASLRITAYYNGVLIAGIEPGSTTQIRALRALTESKNGPSATQINTFLEVRNEGNVPINYSELKARYYFTSDGNEPLQVEVDEGNVQTQLVGLSPAVGGANYYLELRFNQGGQLAPGAGTGTVRYRISKPQGGRFDQSNDYSYQERPQDRSQNSRLVVLLGSEVVWGTPPGGVSPARMASAERGSNFEVTVLGNPVSGAEVRFEVVGAAGQPLQLQLTDLSGRPISERVVEHVQVLERQALPVGDQKTGLLLLRVSTPTQSQTVKVLKTE